MRHTLRNSTPTVTCPETGRVYPIPAGGSTDDAGTPPADPPADPPAGPPTDGAQLPDDHPVLRTMRTEREARKRAERDLQQAQQALATAAQESETEQQRAVREAREQAAAEVRTEMATERLHDRVRVAAARTLNDPEDAVRLVDLDGIDPTSDSLASEIEARITALVTEKPYLAVTRETPSGSPDAASRTPAAGPEQLTRTDLERMTPDQIAKAKAEGRLTDLLQGRSSP